MPHLQSPAELLPDSCRKLLTVRFQKQSASLLAASDAEPLPDSCRELLTVRLKKLSASLLAASDAEPLPGSCRELLTVRLKEHSDSLLAASDAEPLPDSCRKLLAARLRKLSASLLTASNQKGTSPIHTWLRCLPDLSGSLAMRLVLQEWEKHVTSWWNACYTQCHKALQHMAFVSVAICLSVSLDAR